MIQDHWLKHHKHPHYDYRNLPEAKGLALIIVDLQNEIKVLKGHLKDANKVIKANEERIKNER